MLMTKKTLRRKPCSKIKLSQSTSLANSLNAIPSHLTREKHRIGLNSEASGTHPKSDAHTVRARYMSTTATPPHSGTCL